MPVRILRPSLDDFRDTTVLRGVIDRDSLSELKCDFYQREKLPEGQRRDIQYALATGMPLPDIEVGMRGDRFQVEEGEGGAIFLVDPVFIIDGRQRVETLKEHIAEYPETKAALGTTVHFNTTSTWERARFHILNTSRIKVSPSVLLRNIRDDSHGLATLYGLSRSDTAFAMYRRVCWAQNMARNELISGLSYVKTLMRLHSHLAPTRGAILAASTPAMIDRIVDRTGLPIWRANAITFWNLIDELWGIRGLHQKTGTPYLMLTFLTVFADILSDHVDFWRQPDELRLYMDDSLKRKLKKFPVNDPEVLRLAGSAGKARDALGYIMLTHINSGKRTRRLVPRNARATIPPMFDDDENGDDDEPEGKAA